MVNDISHVYDYENKHFEIDKEKDINFEQAVLRLHDFLHED